MNLSNIIRIFAWLGFFASGTLCFFLTTEFVTELAKDSWNWSTLYLRVFMFTATVVGCAAPYYSVRVALWMKPRDIIGAAGVLAVFGSVLANVLLCTLLDVASATAEMASAFWVGVGSIAPYYLGVQWVFKRLQFDAPRWRDLIGIRCALLLSALVWPVSHLLMSRGYFILASSNTIMDSDRTAFWQTSFHVAAPLLAASFCAMFMWVRRLLISKTDLAAMNVPVATNEQRPAESKSEAFQ